MNKKAISNFKIPIQKKFSKMSLDDSVLQSGQKTPDINDSPNRQEPVKQSDNGENDILIRLREILNLRYNLATMKESFIFAQSRNRIPPFLQVSVKFNPYYGCVTTKDQFDEIIRGTTSEFKTEVVKKLMDKIDEKMKERTKEFYETKNNFLAEFDIAEEETGRLRTKMNLEAEKLLNEFKTKRAEFASDLRKPSTNYKTAAKRSDEREKFNPYKKDKNDYRRKEKSSDDNPFTKEQWKLIKNIFK